MDRYGRGTPTGQGQGDTYVMPLFEDGSRYRPGDPVYNRIASIMPATQWNALSDGQRETILINAESDWSNQLNAQMGRSPDRRAQEFQNRAHARMGPGLGQGDPAISEMFRLMQGSSNLSHLDALRGLFGSAPSPPPDPNEYQGPFMPVQGTPTPSPTPVPNPTPPMPQGTPTSGASSFAQALARLMRG